jgi:hypothetical protein
MVGPDGETLLRILGVVLGHASPADLYLTPAGVVGQLLGPGLGVAAFDQEV